MNTHPKSWAFFVALGLSIALLLPLLCGYLGRTGLSVSWRKAGSPAAFQWVVLTAEEGRVRLWLESGPPPKMPAGIAAPRWDVQLYPVLPLRRPDMRRAAWEFDAHRLPGPRNAFILAFPSWCAIAVCLIVPGIWLARRRRLGDGRGFSVVHQNRTGSA